MERLQLLQLVLYTAIVLHVRGTSSQVTQAAVNGVHATIARGRASIPYSTAAPSIAAVFGKALPVVATESGDIIVAAVTYGKGRVVVVTHEGLLPDMVVNVASWACPAPLKAGKVVFTHISSSQDVTQGQLATKNSAFKPSTPITLPTIPPGTHLITTGTLGPLSASEASALVAFVKAGGALIVAGHTWTWVPSPPNADTLVDHPFNRLLLNFGIIITPSTTGIPLSGIPLRAPSALLNIVNGGQAMVNAVTGKSNLAQLQQDLIFRQLGLVQSSSRTLWRVARSINVPAGLFGPGRPVLSQSSAYALHVKLVEMDMAASLDAPPAQVKASPLATAFPSLNTPLKPSTISVTLKIDATYQGYSTHYIYSDPTRPAWRSTGLYLAPGAKATITIPAAATKARLSARIGPHTDDLRFREEWVRAPVVTRSIRLAAVATVVASGYGGLLYIEVPAGAKLGAISITISGDLVRAPWFQLGTTTDADWVNSIRNYPAPWAELASPQFIMTVPSSLVRTLGNPTALMQWWDRVLAAHARVSGLKAPGPFLRRPDRLTADVDISAGYMHAGYPLMVFMDDGAPQALVLGNLQAEGNWGVFHELGHSMQWDDWVLPGTTEATVNIFSAHAMETVVRLGSAQGYGHGMLAPAERAATVAAYKAGGRNFDRDWNVWTALETYMQLKEKFGWGLFPRLFAEYRALKGAERPVGDYERVQQWVWRSSRAAKADLVGFYQAWGFPLAEDTKRRVAALKLPAWGDHPMR